MRIRAFRSELVDDLNEFRVVIGGERELIFEPDTNGVRETSIKDGNLSGFLLVLSLRFVHYPLEAGNIRSN